MKTPIQLPFVFLIPLLFTCCASPMLSPIATNNQAIDYQQGKATLVSRKHNVVALTLVQPEVKEHAILLLSVANLSKTPATIDATDVTADCAGHSLRVFTADQLAHIARVRRGWAIAAAALGGAANAAAASMPARTYTSGTVSTPYGYPVANYTGTTTTYNPAATALAVNVANANTQAQVAGIEAGHQQRVGQIGGVLQMTTVGPNQNAGGVIEIDKSGMTDPVNVHVRFAGEEHVFVLHYSQSGQATTTTTGTAPRS